MDRRRHLAAARPRAQEILEKPRLFPVADRAQHWSPSEDGGFGFGAGEFRGANRPYGAAIHFIANGDLLPIADPERDRERLIAERRQENLKAGKTEKNAPASSPAGQGKAGGGKAEKEDAAQAAKATLEILDDAGLVCPPAESGGEAGSQPGSTGTFRATLSRARLRTHPRRAAPFRPVRRSRPGAMRSCSRSAARSVGRSSM